MRQLAHNRHFYETFPFLLFFRLMEDESKIEEHNISQEDWSEIKKKWVLRNEDWEKDPYSKAQRDEIYHRSRYNKLLLLKERATWSQEGLKELYEKIRFKWIDDRTKREEALNKAILKAKKLHEIFSSQKNKMEDSKLKELETKEAMTVETAYKCIASMELAGANIPDYELLTLGKYEALTATLKKKAS